MKREYYANSIALFIKSDIDEILGKLTRNSDFDLGQNQRDAWIEEINILQKTLASYSGSIYFEYSILPPNFCGLSTTNFSFLQIEH